MEGGALHEHGKRIDAQAEQVVAKVDVFLGRSDEGLRGGSEAEFSINLASNSRQVRSCEETCGAEAANDRHCSFARDYTRSRFGASFDDGVSAEGEQDVYRCQKHLRRRWSGGRWHRRRRWCGSWKRLQGSAPEGVQAGGERGGRGLRNTALLDGPKEVEMQQRAGFFSEGNLPETDRRVG